MTETLDELDEESKAPANLQLDSRSNWRRSSRTKGTALLGSKKKIMLSRKNLIGNSA